MEIGSVTWVHVALMCPHVVKVAHGHELAVALVHGALTCPHVVKVAHDHELAVEAFSNGTVAAATGVAYHLSEALGPH
jgi:hypothetical protein